MAATTEVITLPANEWVNLNRAADVEIGERMIVHNVGSSDIKLTVALSEPQKDTEGYIYMQPRGLPMISEKFSYLTVWAFSQNRDGLVNASKADS